MPREKATDPAHPGNAQHREATGTNGRKAKGEKDENRKTRYAEHTERIRSQNVVSGNFRF